MKELFRSKNKEAIIEVIDGKYTVTINGKMVKRYEYYGRALSFLESKGFCTAFKQIIS